MASSFISVSMAWGSRVGTAVLVAVAAVLGFATGTVAAVLALGQPLAMAVGAIAYMLLLIGIPWRAAVRLGELDALDQQVAGLAVLAGDGVRAGGLLVCPVREQRRVAGAVEGRAGVVGDPAVDRDPGRPGGSALDRADGVERHAGAR